MTLPIAAFAQGFFGLAGRWKTELVGGDTTRGPLAMSVTGARHEKLSQR